MSAQVIPINSLAIQYILDHGLTLEECAALKVEFLSGNEVANRLGLKANSSVRSYPEAIYFPGWRSDGTLNPKYGHGVFLRKGFDAKVVRARRGSAKEQNPQDVIFMPIGRPYSELERHDLVIICESWIKAAIIWLRLGIPAVALNGVRGSSKGQNTLCDGLLEPFWHDCEVAAVILFDSLNRFSEESRTNVQNAERWLASMLHQEHGIHAEQNRGIYEVRIGRLTDPDDPNKKDWGIDEYHLVHGGIKLRAIIDEARRVDPDPIRSTIALMNDQFVWVIALDKVFDLNRPGFRYSKQHFMNNTAGQSIPILRRAQSGGMQLKRVNAGEEWFKSPGRAEADNVVFEPGKPRVFGHSVNLWYGFAVTPSPDTEAACARAERYWVSVIREALQHEPDAVEFFLNVVALLAQHPEVKTSIYIYLLGKFGTGKNFIMRVILDWFGGNKRHAPSLTPEGYTNKFNSRKVSARVIDINEVPEKMEANMAAAFSAELRLDGDANEKDRPLEFKGKDSVYINRCCLAAVTSNYPPPFKIPMGDRRGLILEPVDSMAIKDPVSRVYGTKTVEWWADRWYWMDTTGAADAMAWALSRDLSKFNPASNPPTTAAKARLMQESGRGFSGFVEQLHANPDSVLGGMNVPSGIQYLASDQLLRLFASIHSEITVDPGKVISFGKAMKKEYKDVEAVQTDGSTHAVGADGRPKSDRVALRLWHLRGEVVGDPKERIRQWEAMNDWLIGQGLAKGRGGEKY